ncbi:MAG: hypothetical protein LBR19_05235 [Bifidobacteriaceae bacterium]|jgi:hypothetical protein|nr:hypothetical protein [Bifidobacteriaceae bacterium]
MPGLLRREYTAREFNRDPSAVARAAHRFGQVSVTNRGQQSLIVLDAARFPGGVHPTTSGPSLADTLAMPGGVALDEHLIGEPPRAGIELKAIDPA